MSGLQIPPGQSVVSDWHALGKVFYEIFPEQAFHQRDFRSADGHDGSAVIDFLQRDGSTYHHAFLHTVVVLEHGSGLNEHGLVTYDEIKNVVTVGQTIFSSEVWRVARGYMVRPV